MHRIHVTSKPIFQ